MSRIALSAIVLTVSLSACTTMQPPLGAGPGPALPGGPCNAEPARGAIGQAVNDNVVNQILRDTGSRDARVLGPGDMATMDYRGDRVNIDVNDRGAITGIRCG